MQQGWLRKFRGLRQVWRGWDLVLVERSTRMYTHRTRKLVPLHLRKRIFWNVRRLRGRLPKVERRQELRNMRGRTLLRRWKTDSVSGRALLDDEGRQ